MTDPKVDARSRFSVVAGILVGVAFVSSYFASWALLSPASRAAKCWVQLEEARTSVPIAAILGSAGFLLWIAARRITRGQPAARGISIATFFTVPVLVICLLPFVVVGAFPLSAAGLESDCDRGQPSGIIISSAALLPLIVILIVAIVFRPATKPTSRVHADPEQDQ
ncbi:hypothetical protein E3O47_14790 [Cryobacterium sp. TMT2-17-1]|uniref:hypothetical protein n=1 Tax=unclassified Cryobacterium TaxID=2649013 RepID=UPI001068ECAF|nr:MULTISPECIES: hypothetical protein [unclassified Cryobacterium]TFC47688.1 hypothetical protein E3O47_14790 [Cryobacterium sp. TMT2-17-1]